MRHTYTKKITYLSKIQTNWASGILFARSGNSTSGSCPVYPKNPDQGIGVSALGWWHIQQWQ